MAAPLEERARVEAAAQKQLTKLLGITDKSHTRGPKSKAWKGAVDLRALLLKTYLSRGGGLVANVNADVRAIAIEFNARTATGQKVLTLDAQLALEGAGACLAPPGEDDADADAAGADNGAAALGAGGAAAAVDAPPAGASD